jgi:hypothetical protein
MLPRFKFDWEESDPKYKRASYYSGRVGKGLAKGVSRIRASTLRRS